MKYSRKNPKQTTLPFAASNCLQIITDLCCNTVSVCVCVQAMVGILQGKARGGEEESVLMHDLKPFRILISLLDKPELGNEFHPRAIQIQRRTRLP